MYTMAEKKHHHNSPNKSKRMGDDAVEKLKHGIFLLFPGGWKIRLDHRQVPSFETQNPIATAYMPIVKLLIMVLLGTNISY